ncbi:hypothetical protein Bca101_002687 [Brassica carinata]
MQISVSDPLSIIQEARRQLSIITTVVGKEYYDNSEQKVKRTLGSSHQFIGTKTSGIHCKPLGMLFNLILWLLIARAEALQSDYVFDESSGTKEDPQLYYAPTKPLEEGTSEAEQQWKYVSYETRSEYQKEIEEPYMGNVEKERKVANNSKPNSGNKGMKIVMHEVLSVHGHIFSSEVSFSSRIMNISSIKIYIS